VPYLNPAENRPSITRAWTIQAWLAEPAELATHEIGSSWLGGFIPPRRIFKQEKLAISRVIAAFSTWTILSNALRDQADISTAMPTKER
jgi:hypothetical protein